MEIKIRPATPQDLTGILEIVNHNILHSTALYDYDAKPYDYIETWFAEKHESNLPVIVALEGDKVAGYGTYGPFRFKQGYRFTIEHSVYAAPGHEGKGIGKLLLTELIRLAKEGGYHCMIGGIDANNTGSIEFHKKFGFVETGIIKEAGYKFGKWLDLQFMQLILS
ncbi:N-acetyltransferase [Flavobacterium album]|uniref:N-acetyltransferase n=1 Tax=Flavobacterium album TaxID=2175091 RepID=A0A2S1QZ72_9FLAO|nr:GNAT family N-acetyltransferase [Flavobacterium album]AWH85541.1 N-acetyltransferase [Flavobacterium album]